MSPKGRKRLASDSVAAAAGSVPYSQALRLQRSAAGTQVRPSAVVPLTVRNQGYDADEAFGQSWTLEHGILVKDHDLQYEEGDKTHRVQYVCPGAFLLYKACADAPNFAPRADDLLSTSELVDRLRWSRLRAVAGSSAAGGHRSS